METVRRGTLSTVYTTLKAAILKPHLTLLLVVLLHHKEAAVRSQTPLDEKGIQITHQIGTDAVMTCTVKDLGTRRIIWSKVSDPYPISVGSTKFNPLQKYKIDVIENKSILTIKKIKLEDAGEYQCRVSGQVYLAETLTLNIQAGTGNTYLLPSATEISAEVGNTVLLPCRVENIQDNMVVLWKNSQNDVLTLRKKVYSGDRRLTVIHDTQPEWSLQIKNVRKADFGLYTCIINSQPVLTRTVLLKNATPAQFAPLLLHDDSFRKRVEVSSGELVTLTCNFKASPPANVTWHRRRKVNGKIVKDALGQGNTYTLRSVSTEQSGQYICEGDNGLKPTGRGKIQLTVLAPPTAAPVIESTTFTATGPIAPVLYHLQKKTGQKRGLTAQIKCTAIGLPRPNLHWTKGGQRLADGYKYTISEENFRHDTLHSVLAVKSLTDRDFGNYTCVGYNSLGLHSITFEIYVVN